MKLYYFDIVTSSQETIVDSAEYDNLAAKKITSSSSNYHSDNEAELKWAHQGCGPYVTYTEHRRAADMLLRLVDAADAATTADTPELSNAVDAARMVLEKLNASSKP